MRKVSDHVWLIDTKGLGRANYVAAYLVRGSSSAMLIDAGYASSSDVLIRELVDAGVELDYVFPTHVHLDHCGGVGDLADAFPEAKVIVHDRGARHLVDPSRLIESSRRVYNDALLEAMGLPKPVDASRVVSFKDSVDVDMGGASVRGIYTPGHAPHHASAFVEPDGVIVSGDALSSRAPGIDVAVPPTPPPSFDLGDAIRSLRRLRELDARLALLAHFGPVEVADGFFDEEEEGLRTWVAEVADAVRRGGRQMAIAEMSSKAAALAGLSELPPELYSHLYVSVLGVAAYVEKLTVHPQVRDGGGRRPSRRA